MEWIKPGINMDIIGKRIIAYVFSALLIGVSLVSLVVHGGPKMGVDFAGGSEMIFKFETLPTAEQVRSSLASIGLAKATVQKTVMEGHTQFLIRTDVEEGGKSDMAETIRLTLQESLGSNVELEKVDMVGPQVGKDLKEKALMAMFYALLFITVYISGRFELKWIPPLVMAVAIIGVASLMDKFSLGIPAQIAVALVIAVAGFWVLKLQFAMGAIVALIHDVIITVGVFSLVGKEFNLPIIAALLTIIGYSLNDTIIVFDRIRENTAKHSRRPLDFVINRSINETLSRTLLTSLTTLVVVVCLFVFGGSIIADFAFALMVGVLIGTYSSIFVASPILLAWEKASGETA
ncbi:MAG: protein translocase subunit SecF [Desulfatibacillum sp.]|nr:protein translocase subunit SecF [Desulfatibacillum sp.]